MLLAANSSEKIPPIFKHPFISLGDFLALPHESADYKAGFSFK